MVMYMGQDKETRFYRPSEIGQEDGQSEVEVTRITEKVVCDVCGAEYTDEGSILIVKGWLLKDNYASCPNLSCRGQMEIRRVSHERDS